MSSQTAYGQDTNTNHIGGNHQGGPSYGDNDKSSLRRRAEEAAAEAKRQAEALTAQSSEAAKAEARRAGEKARELADQLTSDAANIADQTVSRVVNTAESAIAQQRDRAAGFVGSVEKAIDAAAQSLREDGYDTMSNYVRYAANTLSSVNDEVGSFEPRRITGHAERAVRRNPLVTYGALAVAGFAFVTLMNSQRR